jgi:hypothetical protein
MPTTTALRWKMEADGTVYYDAARECWAARYDFDRVRWIKPKSPPDFVNPSY